MKLFNPKCAIAAMAFVLSFFAFKTNAQTNLGGTYTDSGYFFDPYTPSAIRQIKTIVQVDTNTYQVAFGIWPTMEAAFQFQLDSKNNLINWKPLNYAPSLPYSGFMTIDNPGNFSYTVSPLPGQSPYVQSIYNNKYDPATKTFYLHYGFNLNETGITGQNGFSSQIYEKMQVAQVKPSPTITSFSPKTGKATTVDTIKGTNLSYTTNVSFGDTIATSFTVLNDSVVVAVVGTGASGSVKVTTLSGSDSLKGFTYVAAVPTITSFSPTTGSDGTFIDILGSGFLGVTQVSFGGVPVQSFYAFSDGEMYAFVGNGATGSVSVTTLGGTASLKGFTYTAPPVITSFTPDSASTGTTVTIKGSGFTTVNSVYFGNSNASTYTVVNDSTITAVVGIGSSGSISVNTDLTYAYSVGLFTYLAPIPTISSFTPTAAGSNGAVSIYGSGFTTTTSVSFGGVAAIGFNVNSDTYLTAYVGAGASGNVSVTTTGGVATLNGFSYLNSPVVTSFSPTSAATGTTVTIKGSYFTNATNVSFGGTNASGFNVVNDSTITATVATGTSGNVTVYIASGYGILGGFTYIAPMPVITSFSPTSAGTNGYVDIIGSGFTGATSVTFGGVPASNFFVENSTTIEAFVGTGATGSVSVTTSGGTATLAGFTYLQSPIVTSFSPDSAATGTIVTIKGSYFTNATGVYFGGTYASNYTVVNDSTITATVSTGSSGSVSVYTAAGSGSLTGFTYIAPVPVITSFSPTSTGKGGYVYIYGTGLTGATSVSFGGVPATNFYVYGNTEIGAYVGNGASGNVSVTTSGGTGSLGGFTFIYPATVTSFTPTKATVGAIDTIYGKGFLYATNVSFGVTNATNFTIINDSTITAVVGTGSSGSVSVTTTGGTGSLAGFTYLAPLPVITSFSPTSQGKGSAVYIYGTGFTGATSVTFGGVPASSYYVESDTYIYAYVGNGASGSVSVTTPGGTATLAGFTYLAPPVITSFSPKSATEGDTVIIKGSGFVNVSQIYFGNTYAASYTVVNDSTIKAVVGAGSSGEVTVDTYVGSGSLAGFTYIAPVPKITSFSPTSATKGGYVYIYGTGLTGATSVTFGGVPATSFYLESDTYIYAYVGNGATGSVSVITPGGTATLAGFVYATTPTITSFSPTTATRGDTITISGTGFSGTTYVYFGGTNASSFTVVNDKTIKAVVGNGSTGSVEVNNPAGSSTLAGFIYTTPPPLVTSFSPTSGIQGDGIYVYGNGFTGATSVSFGGVPASSFYVYSDTYLYAVVGTGATGSVSVTTATGSGSLAGFVYTGSPVITSFTPTNAIKGDTVTIYGYAFTGTTQVTFGGVSASFTIVNDDTIKAVVGNGATGSVSVISQYGTGTLAGFTFVAPTSPSITSFTPTSTCPGTHATLFITGSSFTGATTVTVGGKAVDSFTVNSATSITAYVGANQTGSIAITNSIGTGTSTTSFTDNNGFTAYAYIANRGDNTVSAINTNTNSLVATIPVGSGPSYLTVSQDGKRAYVANWDDNTVSVINTTNNNVVTTITAAPWTTGLAVSPDGLKLYSASSELDSLTVTNTLTNTLITKISVGTTQGISLTPDGSRIYTANFNDNSVNVINTANYSIIATIPVGSEPYGITISPDGLLVYVTNSYIGSNSVSVLNTTSNTVIATIPVGTSPWGVCVTLDGKFLYVANSGGQTVSVINTSTNKVIQTIPVGNHPTGINVSPDGGKVYVTNNNDNTVSVINTSTNSVQETIVVGNSPSSLGNFIANVPTSCISVPPTITSYSPINASLGQSVTIKGSGFTGATTVSFGDSAAASFVVVNDSTITAILGNGASGDVYVTTIGGTDSLAGFSYCTGVMPAVSIATTNPNYTSIVPNTSVTFSATALNAGRVYSYQWYINATAINGATTSTYTSSTLLNNDSIWVVLNSTAYCRLIDSAVSNKVHMYVSDATITDFAGNGTASWSGDGGQASLASLNNPYSVAVDTAGNLYIAEQGNNDIRKVSSKGIITTIAGTGNATYDGDGGAATDASINGPTSVTVDKAGNIYIADFGNNRVRKIDTKGIITTIAGNGNAAYAGDGGLATAASINGPKGIAIDTLGNLYIAEYNTGVIRMVNNKGIITTVAGNGTMGYAGDGGLATSGELFYPNSVAVDNAGNFYIADFRWGYIRKVNTSGIITTVAGSNNPGGGGGGPATTADLYMSTGVAIDGWGNLFISDWWSSLIYMVQTNGIINTVAGNITGSNDGYAIDATLNQPTNVAIDKSGNLYICDAGSNRILKVNAKNGSLPVTFSSFTANVDNKTIETNWRTSTELNTSHFIIQRSTDGSSFTDIGTVKAIGTGANSYSFTDTHPANGINYYRLESVDKDGATSFSKVVTASLTINDSRLTIYPNPAKDNVTIGGNHIASVQVIDNLGRVVKVVALKDATNPTLSVSSLPAGVYHLRIQTTDGGVIGAGLIKE